MSAQSSAPVLAAAPLRVALAGLGTVGTGVVKILQRHGALLNDRAGRPIALTAVSARNRGKDRGVPLEAYAWEDDPVAMARRRDVDLVVEAIGGADGPAKAVAQATLERGAALVTANKAMLAHHGDALAALAEEAGAALRFEAGVAGGIPIVKALTEGLAANRIDRVYGVLNGTCNYVLTEMERAGRDYADVLAEAQALGYAEADPTADVGGWDAAQKLALLAAIAFGAEIDFEGVAVEGIERISLADIRFARTLGYRIKLIGVAARTAQGVERRVSPGLLRADSAIGGLEGVTNAVVCEGDFVGQTVFEGPGAGEGPTASAIVADIIEIARAGARPPFGVRQSARTPLRRLSADALESAYYLRLSLDDQPGALAKVAAQLGHEGVSIDQMRQLGRRPDPATVLIVTHDCPDRAIRAAVSQIAALPVSREEPVALRIERA